MKQIPVTKMQLPCLLMDWREPTQEDKEEFSHCGRFGWVAEYLLVMPSDKGDIRMKRGSDRVSLRLSATVVTGGAPDRFKGNGLDLPFRDGVHLIRDSRVLRLPAYVRYKEHCLAIVDEQFCLPQGFPVIEPTQIPEEDE